MIIRNNKGEPESVPCGMCEDCRLEKASQWASRCVHEAQMYKHNSFITLTYAPEHLPPDHSVHKNELTEFIRKLRRSEYYPGSMPIFDNAMRLQYYRAKWHKKYREVKTQKEGKLIRFYGCGEYGEKLGRPHYHVLLFNHDFKDKEILRGQQLSWTKTHFTQGNIHTLYKSETLEKIWGKGFCTIGEVTYDSAGYVARYIRKKVLGDINIQADHYNGKHPEFALMSRMPGIGLPWLKKYLTDVYPKDFFTINGIRKRPPRFYDDYLAKCNPTLYEELKTKRKEAIVEEDSKRMYERSKHRKLITQPLIRSLENGN
jgi:hypothetical protein